MQQRAFVGVAKATSHVVAEKKVKRSPLFLAQVDVFFNSPKTPLSKLYEDTAAEFDVKPSTIKTNSSRFWKEAGFRNLAGFFLRNVLGVRIRLKSDFEEFFFQYFR